MQADIEEQRVDMHVELIHASDGQGAIHQSLALCQWLAEATLPTAGYVHECDGIPASELQRVGDAPTTIRKPRP